MRLLRALTLGYVTVLIPTLAASLIAIWVQLRRIASVLGDVREALVTVRDRTAPLAGHLQPVDESLAASAEDLATAQARFEHLAAGLSVVAEQPGRAGSSE